MHERLLRQTEKLEDPQKFTREKSQLWSVKPLAQRLLQDISENNLDIKARSCNPDLVTPLAKSVADSYLRKLGLSSDVVLSFADVTALKEKMNPSYIEELKKKGTLQDELNAHKTVTGYAWKEDVVMQDERKEELSQSLHKLVSDAHTAQQDITTAHIYLANRFAQQYLHKKKAAFDPVSEAYAGLTKAAQRYDWRCGYKFNEFAPSTIRGEIVRALRDHGETVKKPRAVFEKAIHVLRAESALEQEGGMYGTEEIAKKIGAPIADVEAVKNYRSATSLDREVVVDSTKPTTLGEQIPDPDADVEGKAIDKALIKGAMDLLDERSREIIFKLFYEGKSQQQVGDEIGISQMHVSRLQKRALEMMRGILPSDERDEVEKSTQPKERKKRKIDSP